MRIAPVLLVAIAAAACGGGSSSSPTAPTNTATTTTATTTTTTTTVPTTTTTTTLPPATPATVTGTWINAGTPVMTLTQSGSSVSGNVIPVSVNFSGITSTVSGTITGSVSGTTVTLTGQITVAVRAGADTLNCRGGDTYSLQLSGNTMTGTFTPQSTAYVCDGGIPLPISFPSGPIVLTRQ